MPLPFLVTALFFGGSVYYQHRQAKKAQAKVRQAEAEAQAEAQNSLFRSMQVQVQDSPRIMVFGYENKIGGNLIWMHRAPDTTYHMVIALCVSPLRRVTKIYINDEVVWEQSGTFVNYLIPTKFVGNRYGENINGYIVNSSPDPKPNYADILFSGSGYPDETKWTEDHWRARDFAFGCFAISANPEMFSGPPALSFVVEPSPQYIAAWSLNGNLRSDSLANPVYALLEYMRSPYGMNLPETRVDIASFTAAANNWKIPGLHPAPATLKSETTYIADLTKDHRDHIEALLDCCNGRLSISGGKFKMQVGVRSTYVMNLTEDGFVGRFNVRPTIPGRDRFNAVNVKYTNQSKLWAQDNYLHTLDGIDPEDRIVKDIELAVSSAAGCAQVAAQLVRQQLNQITVECEYDIRAMQLEAGDIVRLTNAKYGFSDKEFEVEQVKLESQNGEIRFRLQLQEYDPDVYNDAAAPDELANGPETNLPNRNYVPTPTSFSVTEELYGIGDIVTNRVNVSWTANSYFTSHFEVQYRRSGDTDWKNGATTSQLNASFDLDVTEADDYEFRVSGVNSFGFRSPWTELTVEILGKTAPPADVSTISQQQNDSGFSLKWAKVADLDVNEYLVRWGTTSQVWADVADTEVRTGTSLIVPFFAAGTRRYFVKAVDTSGNESETAATADITISAPVSVYPTIAVVDQQLVISWSEVAAGSGYLNVLNYEVRYGASWAAGTLVGLAKTTRLIAPIFPAGTRTYWLAAIDVAGNVGTPQSQPVTLAAPGDVTSTSVVKSDAGIVVSWAAPSVGSYQFPIANYDIRYGASWAAGTPLGIAKTTTITTPFFAAGTRQFWIAAIDVAGNVGSAVGSEFVINVPGQPESLTAVKSDAGVVISWGAAAVGTNQLPIVEYEVRYGASFDAGTLVGIARTTTITSAFFSAAERFYFIKARDVVGNVTATAASVSFTIENPDAISSATITINDEDALLSFDFPAIGSDQLPIREFEIRVGPTYATSSLVALTLSTQIKIPFFKITAIPSQARTYWITPVDIVGNAANPFSVDFTINQPSAPLNLVVQAVRNVVFINWTQPDSTVPIRYYRVSKQDSPADQIYGDFDSTAYRIEEPVGGTFTYKVQAIDFVGNISNVSSQSIVVDDPDGFEIVTTFSDPNYNTVGSITGDDFVDDGGIAIILGMNSTDTFTEHFTDNSWTTPQDQIDAGYLIFAQPVESGNWTYSGEFDIGAVVAAGTIILTAAKQILNGLDFAQFEPEISVKESSGDPWIEFDNVWSASTVDFRYIRIRIFIEIDSDQQVVNLAGAGVTVVVQVAKKTESGVASAVSSDVGGTSVSLVRTFVDISEVICTVNGSSAYFATATWTDPNPTEIQIFAFDTSNNRVNASVSYTVRGV